jgi:glucose-1-phosphate thymidylyltransferase
VTNAGAYRPLTATKRTFSQPSIARSERYGVIAFDADGVIQTSIERPWVLPSYYAVMGLYFLDDTVLLSGRNVKPSARGELAIATLLVNYRHNSSLCVKCIGRGFT